MSRQVRTLLFSTLYPSSARPGHGIFVETRLRELLRGGAVQAKVIAPVPWFPSRDSRFGDYAALARTPHAESRHEIDVLHPRYLLPPRVGMTIAPFLLAWAGWRAARRLRAQGFDFDLIDAHYFYPDGVAAAVMARWLGRPFVVTARGSDINLIATHSVPRRLMLWAARRAAACIGVSGALVDAMARLGMPRERLHLMRNGVDLQRFRPIDRAAARASLGVEGDPLLLSVANLVPLKGHDLCISALARIKASCPGARLLIAGSGPERERLQEQARRLGVADRVHLAGSVPNTELATWYSAADMLLLASSREGWPNVLLESMACGTPVVATAVGGIPEIVRPGCGGRLLGERTDAAIAEAVFAQRAEPVSREAVRRYAESFGWEQTSRQQESLFRSLSHAGAGRA